MPFLDDSIVIDEPADASTSSAPAAVPAQQPAQTDAGGDPYGIVFKSPDDLAKFRKTNYPNEAHLTDEQFLDWFGKSRQIPSKAIVLQPQAEHGAPVAAAGPPGAPAAAAASAVGGTFLPDDIKITDHPATFGREVGIATRGAVEGLTDLGDTALKYVVPGGNLLQMGAQALGAPTGPEAVRQVENTVGLPTPEGVGENLLAKGVGGVATGLATAGIAPAAGLVAPAIAGGTSALSGEAARLAGYGTPAQIAASLAGGGVGAAAATGIPRAIAGLASTNRAPSELMQAFDRLQVPALAADVGGIGSRMMTGIANMTLGGIPLGIAARNSVAAARAARARIAEAIGTPFRNVEGLSDNLGAGLAAQRGVKAVLGEGGTKQAIGEDLYKAIPIPPHAPATLSNSRAALAELNEGLASNEELSKLIQDKRLQAYEQAFVGKTEQVPTGILDHNGAPITRAVQKGGALSWRDLQSFRSYVGELAGRPTLQDSTSQAALRRLYAGLSEDMRATAAGQGKAALAKFTRANNYWRALQTRREEILKPLLGNDLNLHGEAAFRRIEQWSTNNGDVFALARALRSMPEEEANSIRATIFDRLGNVTKGRNDASGLVFSPNDFVTHWNGLSSRAKSALFPGADYRQSIDDLVRVTAAQKGAQQFANVSKTGNAVNGLTLLKFFFTDPLSTLALGLTEIGAGKMLASPRVARWMASAPRKPTPVAALAHINRLSTIAAAEPAIANEVLQLQERLAQAFADTPMKAAASGPIPNQDERNGR